MSASDVTVVTVAFNSQAVLPTMLASVPEGVPVIVVDNGSDDPATLNEIRKVHPFSLIRSETNLGFGGGCNLGAASVGTRFILFLNPDAQLDPGAIDALKKAAAEHPGAGAYSPRILDRNGRPAFRRRSRLLPRAVWWSGPVPTADCTIPILAGAAIFVEKSKFDAVGGFDTAIFLYHEDDDLGLRLAAHGPIRYVHDAIVRHAEGHGSPRTPASAQWKAFHMARSALYAMRKHRRPAALLRLGAHAAGKFLSPMSWISSRKRAQALGFAQGLFSNQSSNVRNTQQGVSDVD